MGSLYYRDVLSPAAVVDTLSSPPKSLMMSGSRNRVFQPGTNDLAGYQLAAAAHEGG
jgi:hypothetical protein